MRTLSLALAVAVTLGACNQAGARDEISYGVLDVAANDVLNMRAAPSPTANVVAAIPQTGEGIVATGATAPGGWSEVMFQGKRGWVNARFLGFGKPGESRLPALLECLGAEPFWGITLSPGAARAELVFAERVYNYRLTRAAPAMGRVDIWIVKGSDGRSDMTMIVRRETCSDGMSDTSYPYSSFAMVPGAELIAGCCRPHQPR